MQILNWDKELIEELYSSCYPSISKWIRSNSGIEQEAEDVFQDAVAAVYQKTKDPHFKLNCKLSTFIFGVAKKMWLHKLRTRGRYMATDFAQESEISSKEEKLADDIIEDAEIESVYKRHFEKLTAECKKILTLFFNGRSMNEIIAEMKYPNSGMARKRKFNCKNELVKLVKGDPMYNELVGLN